MIKKRCVVLILCIFIFAPLASFSKPENRSRVLRIRNNDKGDKPRGIKRVARSKIQGKGKLNKIKRKGIKKKEIMPYNKLPRSWELGLGGDVNLSFHKTVAGTISNVGGDAYVYFKKYFAKNFFAHFEVSFGYVFSKGYSQMLVLRPYWNRKGKVGFGGRIILNNIHSLDVTGLLTYGKMVFTDSAFESGSRFLGGDVRFRYNIALKKNFVISPCISIAVIKTYYNLITSPSVGVNIGYGL